MRYSPTPPFLLLRRLLRLVEERGFRRTIVTILRSLFHLLRKRGVGDSLKRLALESQAPTLPRELIIPQNDPFDLLNGTDTSGYILGGNLSAVSLSGVYNIAYGGIAPSALRQALSALAIRYEDFTFVDLGCGKGRALLVAAEYPFRRLLGVEIATELCVVAEANVATRADWAARIAIVNQDAVNFSYPEGPLLIYLYNPFLPPVLRRVLKSLERQIRRSPRPVYVLYALNTHLVPIKKSFVFLRELSETVYPVSPEDTAADCFQRNVERFTLYSADLKL